MKIEESIFYRETKYVKTTNLKSLCLSILLSIFLTSCGGQNGSMAYDKLRVLDRECEYPLDAGEDITDFTFSEEAIEEGPFGRPYNTDFLEKISKASTRATLNFAHALGIKTVKVGESDSKCQLFYFLEKARGESLKTWTTIVDGGRNPAGLYFSINSSRSLLPVEPTIILRVDSNRQTLVHELMHYNFHRTKTSMAKINQWELEHNYSLRREDLNVNLQAYLQNKNSENFEILVESMTSVVSILEEYLLEGRDSMLEEVSIEYILIKSYLEGELEYVPDSVWGTYSYMSGNANLLLRTFVDPIKNIISTLIKDAEVYWEHREHIQSLSEEINRFTSRLQNVLNQAEKSMNLKKWVGE